MGLGLQSPFQTQACHWQTHGPVVPFQPVPLESKDAVWQGSQAYLHGRASRSSRPVIAYFVVEADGKCRIRSRRSVSGGSPLLAASAASTWYSWSVKVTVISYDITITPLLLEESRWSAHPPELPACPYCYYMKTEAIRQYEQIGAICIFTAGFSIGTNLYLRT